jgi:hypothetical protein
LAGEESMTTTHLESTKLPCHGCFAPLSMTITPAFCMETIFEIAFKRLSFVFAASRNFVDGICTWDDAACRNRCNVLIIKYI